MTKNQYILTILVFFTLVYLLPLGVRPLLGPDETRYAAIPREMVSSGDWVLPQLNGLKYYEKPIMGYWVHAIFQDAFGESNFIVRLPSVVAAALTTLLIYILTAAVTGRRNSRAYLAPLIYISSFGIYAISTITVMDNILNFFLTAGLVLFFFATEQQNRSALEKALLFLAGLFIGCAFLTKGFLAFVVPVITIIPYLILQKRANDILRMLILWAFGAIAISLPWSVLAYLRDPEFWNFFFWHEHVKRFFSDNAQHMEPFYYYFITIIPLFIPWIFLLPAACIGLINHSAPSRKYSRLLIYSVCWLVLPFIFFSLSRGKLVTYILPCFPPLVILTTMGICDGFKKNSKYIHYGIIIFLSLSAISLLGILATQLMSFEVIALPQLLWKYDAQSFYYSASFWKPALVSFSIFAMLFFSLLALRSKKLERRVWLIAISPLLLMISAQVAVPDLTLTVKAPGGLLEQEAKNIPDEAIIIADTASISAVCWYLKRNDIYLFLHGGELSYGLSQPDSRHRLLNRESLQHLLAKQQDKKIIMFLRTDNWQKVKNALPDPVKIDDTGKYGFTILALN
jgi:4-amino-4-deoxy-L-arabinose transferase